MIKHLTPSTIEAMYKDLDEARLELLKTVNDDNLVGHSAEYHELSETIHELDTQYEALTGEALWAKVLCEA